MRRIRSRLTYANVTVTILAFIVLSGGTAVALTGSNTVQSDDLGPGAQVQAPDVAANAVGSPDVVNESLTGQDIQNRSGVDNCLSTARIGQLCMRAENSPRPWDQALQHCANLDLRMPTLGEALQLAKTHDMPLVDESEIFWTQNHYWTSGIHFADVVDDTGGVSPRGITETGTAETVCVTTPIN